MFGLKKFPQRWVLACLVGLCTGSAFAQSGEFNFAVLAPPSTIYSEADWHANFSVVDDDDDLAFVVVNGIKSAAEPCTDVLYEKRKNLLSSARHEVMISLAASDWSVCKNAQGRSIAVERLNRLRELFFAKEIAADANKIVPVRQSSTMKFPGYAENARWEFGNVMFASVNLPANNNHYRAEAGRNSEFEDRLVANRDWLQRVFSLAKRQKREAVVLFCDGNPWIKPPEAQRLVWGVKRDGFAEMRRHIQTLAAQFAGKVLILCGPTGNPASAEIHWYGNVGVLEVVSNGVTVRVMRNPTRFDSHEISEEAQPL